MIQQLLLVAHVLIAIGIITFVLIQRGKGAEAGAAFGAGASGTVFGSRGSASFLTRTTAVLATGFFATSLALAFFANQPRQATGSSVIGETDQASGQTDAGADNDLDLPPPAAETAPASDLPPTPPADEDGDPQP